GITINAANGRLDLLDFTIADNTIANNTRYGIHLRTVSDAMLSTVIRFNTITGNADTGIQTDGLESVINDLESQSGTWVGNLIAENAGHGIQINGVTGTATPFIIGQVGTDPATGRSLGNVIDMNGRDGIEVNAGGFFELNNNTITRNGWAVVGDARQGGGVDVSAVGVGTISMRMVQNTIEDNRGDGLELQAGGTVNSIDGTTTRTVASTGDSLFVTALGNTIDFNDGRGVDLLNAGDSISYVRFGDGTAEGANSIVSNGGIGFYVVQTASINQTQDVAADVDLLSDGSLDRSPDMVLDINRNRITANNNNGGTPPGVGNGFDGGGLVLRVGTSNSSRSFTGADATGDIFGDGSGFGDPTGNGVGSNSGELFAGNGRVNARVVDNTFGGNLGEDVYIESFVSTVDPPVTAGTWDDMQFTITTFRRDPLARLNLVFRGNTGDSIDLTRGEIERSNAPGSSNVTGAYYQTAEPDFKSRENNKTAPNPSGPFDPGGNRRRNAQRIAGRDILPPNSGPDIAPTGLGIFEYDGIGASTFRIEADFDTTGFTAGTGFILDGPLPPFLTGNANGVPFSPPVLIGEEPFGWGAVAPGTFTFPDYLFP
ncbi:MAG TPA: right-handed parallel beta-helix repeat-containing protein, partial [Planctomycetaceae bacterium]|nr:right-handed parallel beta-helix repeat-containing protein [Planctomycetaceae bacterium]